MKYKQGSDFTADYLSGLAPSGAVSSFVIGATFVPWQPSTWPLAPAKFTAEFLDTLKQIFDKTILDEIGNVIGDIKKSNGDLQHRGHVVAIALMCAVDALSSYGYDERKKGANFTEFVRNHFPAEYKPHADSLYEAYRCFLVHSWNLFEATILPGDQKIEETNGTLSFGLLNFFDALRSAVESFLTELRSKRRLQYNSLRRYQKLKKLART